MKRISVLCVLAIFVAHINCDTNELEAGLEKLKSSLPDGVNIPDSLIPDTFKNISWPSMDDAKKAIKEKCDKVSGNDETFAKVEASANNLMQCITGLINVDQLQKDIKEAQPKGELDTVFNGYCRNRTIAIDCLTNLTTTVEPCLEPKEIEGQNTFVKIFTNLLNFVCYKDGDQIALFIAEKGPECFEDKKDYLLDCFNTTFKKYLPEEVPQTDVNSLPTTLPLLVLGQEQCNDMDALQTCVVEHLETCKESTPANLVESMFKFVRNETVCGDLKRQRDASTRASSASFSFISWSMLTSVFTLMSVRSLLL